NIVKKILRQKANEGSAIFMSTHLLSIAEELCDRIAIIKDGSIIFESDSRMLKEIKYSNDKRLESLFIELMKEEKKEFEEKQ
ncbi:MAG: ABC transporter ATP-binding protein, partial [Ignavibacteria bacterium]